VLGQVLQNGAFHLGKQARVGPRQRQIPGSIVEHKGAQRLIEADPYIQRVPLLPVRRARPGQLDAAHECGSRLSRQAFEHAYVEMPVEVAGNVGGRVTTIEVELHPPVTPLVLYQQRLAHGAGQVDQLHMALHSLAERCAGV